MAVVQGDGAALPGGQPGHGRAHGVRSVQVLGRGQAGGGVQGLRPVRKQRDRGTALQAAADVRHDAAKPAGEPVRVTQPVKPGVRPQE
jgi:hypothetical protein